MATMEQRRDCLVTRQIEARGVRDPLVLAAMKAVRRELFVPKHLRDEAYDDTPLPIGSGQTISQPYIVAFMIEALALRGGEKVLEIGAGSGYAAAVLSRIAGTVIAIERHGVLADLAAARMAALGYANIRIVTGDGSAGWPEGAPYDAILVAASGRHVPEALKRQLKVGGSIVMPIGAPGEMQSLFRVTRQSEEAWEQENLGAVRFVPLIGTEGWRE